MGSYNSNYFHTADMGKKEEEGAVQICPSTKDFPFKAKLCRKYM